MGQLTDNNLLICYYGDDFTGSTDSLEALTSNGVRSVLFIEVPSSDLLKQRFADFQGFGVAGVSRSMTPLQMERELTQVLQQMRAFQTPIMHYKVCSTFDSSPEIGSIGKVMDIGKKLFPAQKAIPLLVGAPVLRRYTVFGNHFASIGTDTFRLDRHPNMMKHPVTPMAESDLRLHLRKQAELNTALMDIFALEADLPQCQQKYESLLRAENDVVLFDVINDNHLARAGQLIWEESGHGPQFVVGSSGVEYALTQHWKKAGIIHELPEWNPVSPVDRLLVVSGSCSPVTQQQISWSLDHGFRGIRVSSQELIFNEQKARQLVFNQALKALEEGDSLIIYTAYGSEDPDIARTRELLVAAGLNPADTGMLIGQQLGRLVKELVPAAGLKRVIIAGGDTSGYAMQELGVYGLEMIRPLAPGAPLCRCYADDPDFDGLEIVLKGGQVGAANFFASVRLGERD